MAETKIAANNKTVDFGIKKAEGEFSGARMNAEDQPANGRPPKKKMSKAKRKTAKRAIRHGMISEKAAKKHLGEGY